MGLEFDYALSSGLAGFYRTQYLDGDGVERVVAATQFESMSARKAFPCFDEPALKVCFNTARISRLKPFEWSSRKGKH